MDKLVGLFPVLPGKDPRVVGRVMEGRAEEYRESRRRLGIHLERAYEQVTPMGTFVIAYIESDRPFMETAPQLVSSGLAVDRDFVAGIKDVHGMDPAQPPAGEPPELLGDWVDEGVSARKRGLAFCAPVAPGAADIGRAFAKEAFANRRDEHTQSRRAHGITHEAVMLNHTPMGDVVCVYLEGDDPVEGNRRFAESRSDYDVWFKNECRRVFPPEVDFDQPLPPITQLFDSEEFRAGR
jgi:hypothetical protein